MKSLIRWSATVGLVGATIVGSLVGAGLQALALTPEQIVQKLRPVPMFTIANAQGAPLVASPPNGQKGSPVAGVFVSQKDAQAFLETLKSKNPNLAKEVKVVPVSPCRSLSTCSIKPGQARSARLCLRADQAAVRLGGCCAQGSRSKSHSV